MDESVAELPSRYSISIQRELYTRDEVKQKYGRPNVDEKISAIGKLFSTWHCSFGFIVSFFPIVGVLKSYNIKKHLAGDVISGLSAACLHLPQGLAFGILSSLAPAYGLYTSFFPVLFYVLFGMSPHVSFGTNAVIALATADLVDTAATGAFPSVENNGSSDPHFAQEPADGNILLYKASVASGAAFLSGLILLGMGLCRLGFLTSYLSTSFIGGFTTAAAFHIFSSQVPKALGISIPSVTDVGKLIYMYINIFKAISTVNVGSLITAIISAVVLLFVKDYINEKFKDKLKIPIPIDLLVVIAATLISTFGKLEMMFSIRSVGVIPSGIPPPSLPRLSPVHLLLPKALEIAILVFFLTISMTKLCAQKHGYEVDDNQELIAYGVSNFGSSYFHCFPSCLAPPRTMVLSMMGAKTTLNGLVSALVMLLVLLVMGHLFSSLPVPVLAVMVMVAVKRLLAQVCDLPKIYRQSKYDFSVWIVTCLSGILLDLVYGLLFGVISSLYVFVLHSQLQTEVYLSKANSEDLFLDEKKCKDYGSLPSIKVVQPSTSLYFATADLFRKRLYRTLLNPVELRRRNTKTAVPVKRYEEDQSQSGVTEVLKGSTINMDNSELKALIIDLTRVNYLDINGVSVLDAICSEYNSVDILVYLGSCSDGVYRALENSAFFDSFPREHLFHDINDAFTTAVSALMNNSSDV